MAVYYKGVLLAKNSESFELYEAWQSAKSDRNKRQKQLDDHMKQLEKNEIELIKRYEHLEKK